MIEITPIEYGKSVLKESVVFHAGCEDKLYPMVFMIYLIRTEDRTILVDAGCETMPGFMMEDFQGAINAFKKHDVTPDEITDVIITHAHHDHIECVKYFTNALIHIQKDEYESGRGYIPDNFKTNVFTDSFKVLENIRIIRIGGHSKGSCVVEINKDDKIFAIAGDECYSRLCLSEKRYTGSSFDEKASKDFILKYSDPKYTVLLCHDG